MFHPSSTEVTKQSLLSPGRTQGDGMESDTESTDLFSLNKTEKSRSLGDRLIYRPLDLNHNSSTPPVITGKIVNLVPKQVTPSKKYSSMILGLKGKEPKFIPYEPYKAAVKPIIPYENKKKNPERKTSRKHNDIPIVPLSVTNVDNVAKPSSDCLDENTKCENEHDWQNDRKAMQEEIKTLKEENGQLESQLKFQAQVNGELKALLVAAVGEDIETRVHLLTEDKLQLARALLTSSQRLSTHQEQTEWLAGQCEVWRSKFLASSLMVEELAKWKAALTQRTTELQEAMKRLLEERLIVRDSLLSTYKDLCVLRHHFDHSKLGQVYLPSSNILNISATCQQLSNVLRLQLLGSVPAARRDIGEPDLTGLDMRTLAEKTAENLLLSPNTLLLTGPDVACSAVMGAAVAVGALGPAPMAMKCCAHCSGEVKTI